MTLRHWTTRGARALRAAILVVTAAIALSSCGIAADSAPHIVNKNSVPFGLLRPSPTTTQATPPGEYVTIYLEGAKHLVAVSRNLPAPVTVAAVLHALGDGPTSLQAAHGLQSPISTASPITLWRARRTTVTVSVSSTFTKLAEEDQTIAVAQLVYTLTALPGVESVKVRIAGKRAKVPTAKGTLSGGPLQRSAYATLAPI
jgi:spore germination protein GerM